MSPFLLVLPMFGLVFCISLLFYKCNDVFTLLMYVLIAGILSWQFKKYIVSTWYCKIIILGVSAVVLLLAFLYLVAQGQARSSSPDSSIRNSISSLRAHAEIENLKNGSYSNLCQTEAVVKAKNELESQYLEENRKCFGPLIKFLFPEKKSAYTLNCNATDEQYAIEARLINAEAYTCVDSSGVYKTNQISSISMSTRCE